MDVQHLNGLADRLDLGVGGRIVARDHAVAGDGQDLPSAHDRGAEGPALSAAQALEGGGDRLLHEIPARRLGHG